MLRWSSVTPTIRTRPRRCLFRPLGRIPYVPSVAYRNFFLLAERIKLATGARGNWTFRLLFGDGRKPPEGTYVGPTPDYCDWVRCGHAISRTNWLGNYDIAEHVLESAKQRPLKASSD